MDRNIIIPVRSGSKSLPHKNILPFCGVPLLGYVVAKIKKTGLFKNIIVSSDSSNYLKIAENYGANFCIIRPSLLSSDKATTVDVLKHAIIEFEKKIKISSSRYILSQVTSPLWNISVLKKFLKKSDQSNTSVVTVCESKQNPYYNLLKKENKGYGLLENKNFKRRQDHPKVYFINGCFYSFSKEKLFYKNEIIEENTQISIMKQSMSLDIDDKYDFKICELIAKNGNLFA